MFEGIAIGVGSTVVTGMVLWIAAALARVWRTPKRLDRVEAILPVLLRSNLAMLRCQKAGTCNGDTDAAIRDIETLLTNAAVSQKGKS